MSDKDWDDVFRLYSEESFIYGGSNSIFESIKQLEGIDFIEFGYFGESIRNLSWVENWQGSDIEKEEIAYEFLNHRAGNSTKGLNSTLISINMFIEEFFSIVDDHEELDIDDMRDMLGVEAGKLDEYRNLRLKAIEPAIAEVNAITPYHVDITPINKGRKVIGFKMFWSVKDKAALMQSYKELQAAKVGRKVRQSGEEDVII